MNTTESEIIERQKRLLLWILRTARHNANASEEWRIVIKRITTLRDNIAELEAAHKSLGGEG